MNPTLFSIIERVKSITPKSGTFPTEISDLEIIRSDTPTVELQTLHKPAICIVLQGKKRVMVGKEIFDYSESEYLSVSFDIPVRGQVIEASEATPYLCIKLNIDICSISTLIMEMKENHITQNSFDSGVEVAKASNQILEPVKRLINLLSHPEDIKILAPIIKQEIFYRILKSNKGSHLAALINGAGKSKQIANAIMWIKNNFSQPFCSDVVANVANLSVSAFHKHFKNITLMSPLQFQKQLRLLEARRLIIFEGKTAAYASITVGYESQSQFSREYSRAFGKSPKSDLAIAKKVPSID